MVLLPASVGCVLPRLAEAQTLELPRPRQGYYVGGGLGLVGAKVWDDGEPMKLGSGSAITLRTGEMLTTHLGLGLSIDTLGATVGKYSASWAGLALEGQWEFMENLSLRGSAGLAFLVLDDTSDPDADLRGSYGTGYTLGLSYDWFFHKAKPSGGWSLQPILLCRYLADDPITSVTGLVGIEVLYWTGLPKNQLKFAPGEGYEKD